MSSSSDIAERLASFGQQKFGNQHGWKRRFADGLKISPQHLERYLSGNAAPGKKMWVRLIQLGCDVQWLMSGKQTTAETGVSVEETEILKELRRAGIRRVDQIRYLLDPERMAADIAAAAIRELKSKYRTRSRRSGKR